MKLLNLKPLAAGLAACLLMFGIFANQALAAPTPPARVVVAKSGGNYTTITAALAAINPTATTPYVIEVWPGVYNEPGTVNLKSYVHIKGSGRDVTTVKTSLGATANIISVDNKTNVTISGLTISGGRSGISLNGSLSGCLATISENTISGNNSNGIYAVGGNQNNSLLITGNKLIANLAAGLELNYTSATVSQNLISGNGSGRKFDDSGIVSDGFITTPVLVTGNVITGNNGTGILAWGLNFTISDNIVTDNTLGGVDLRDGTAVDVITHNKIVNNGAQYADILVGTSVPNISFNVFNTITGTTGVGSYNVDLSGVPITVP